VKLYTDDPSVASAGNAYLVRVIPPYVIPTLQFMHISAPRGRRSSLPPRRF
jgi:hypothetical protein